MVQLMSLHLRTKATISFCLIPMIRAMVIIPILKGLLPGVGEKVKTLLLENVGGYLGFEIQPSPPWTFDEDMVFIMSSVLVLGLLATLFLTIQGYCYGMYILSSPFPEWQQQHKKWVNYSLTAYLATVGYFTALLICDEYCGLVTDKGFFAFLFIAGLMLESLLEYTMQGFLKKLSSSGNDFDDQVEAEIPNFPPINDKIAISDFYI